MASLVQSPLQTISFRVLEKVGHLKRPPCAETISSSELTFFSLIMDGSILALTPK